MAGPWEHGRPRRSRVLALALAILAGGLLGSPVGATDALPGEPNPPWEDGALPAEVVPDLENVRPVTWEHILVAPDGQTLVVYFSAGPPGCEGLAAVEAEQVDGEVRVQLRVGDVPGAEVCAAISQLYRVVVVLDERAVTGGSILDLPSG